MKVEIARIVNIVKSIILLLALIGFVSILFYILGYLYHPSYAMFAFFLGIISSAIYCLINLVIGPSMILQVVGARPLEEHPRYEEVKMIVEDLCKKAGIPLPKLWYIPSRDINAFATGILPSNSHIAITLGALEYLNREELALPHPLKYGHRELPLLKHLYLLLYLHLQYQGVSALKLFRS